MHPRVLNPIVADLRKSLTTTYHTIPLDFLTESWVVKFLASFDNEIFNDLFQKQHEKINLLLLEESIKLRDIKINNLEGLFNLAKEIIESGKYDVAELKEGFERLVSLIAEKNWLSTPSLACYAVFGLNGIISSNLIENAKSYINGYYGSDIVASVFSHPEILLAFPSVIGYDEIQTRLQSDSDALDSSKANALFLYIITNYSDDGNLVQTTESLIETTVQDYVKQTGEFNFAVQAQVGCSFLKLGLKKVHLLNEKDYAKISLYFQTETTPISRKVEYVQELIILGCVAVIFYYGLLPLGPLIVDFFSLAGQVSPDLAGYVLTIIMGILFGRFIAPILLPQLTELGRRIVPDIRREKKSE
ncbi:MAG: hypothetical protein P1Q69_02060 [Candidatus Thorarchaeota archaeon]|nr:hypothetical protein [Candidatus Thorarchaeota archaeon]